MGVDFWVILLILWAISLCGPYILWMKQKFLWPGLAFVPQPFTGIFLLAIIAFFVFGGGLPAGIRGIWWKIRARPHASKLDDHVPDV
jgi:hypothetical protein